MTPAARIAAACEILDRVLAGASAEATLTNWARGNRFAGSGDRAAIRDLVFDALRCKRSYAVSGGGLSGRGLMLGHCRAQGIDPSEIFTSDRFAPMALTVAEAAAYSGAPQPHGNDALDCPDWLAPLLQDSLGADFAPVMLAGRQRAPVFLRVNLARTTRPAAIAALAAEGIRAQSHSLASSALVVLKNYRKIHLTQVYADGLVELQDVASQAMIEGLALSPKARILDYCAGGGGKALALAMRVDQEIVAHDAAPERMRDIPARAARAGVRIRRLARDEISGQFDLVLVDAPCSGSGTWRRTPEAKWRLTPARLEELQKIQCDILVSAAPLVKPGGVLVYMTCSFLRAENEAQTDDFAATNGWIKTAERRLTPLDGGDGFYCCTMRKFSDAAVIIQD
ncbi:RsmB/NOP family class I SAM-dependent RNA methyltransferase [Phaeovulum sp.]|uniref:RsmB/NOP family class I SAM-dependent RNA methyltransferase n=1 Tax=Phaeovulum sp. TaxID=2934796 RepID=UPI0039E4044D